mmetsp:Transcript_19014/g.48547  ORF Transcript_19014/g.48547 Transcript_19014/m.48547 type:complete len:109 (-) Transcript_19014:618-944(-)
MVAMFSALGFVGARYLEEEMWIESTGKVLVYIGILGNRTSKHTKGGWSVSDCLETEQVRTHKNKRKGKKNGKYSPSAPAHFPDGERYVDTRGDNDPSSHHHMLLVPFF